MFFKVFKYVCISILVLFSLAFFGLTYDNHKRKSFKINGLASSSEAEAELREGMVGAWESVSPKIEGDYEISFTKVMHPTGAYDIDFTTKDVKSERVIYQRSSGFWWVGYKQHHIVVNQIIEYSELNGKQTDPTVKNVDYYDVYTTNYIDEVSHSYESKDGYNYKIKRIENSKIGDSK